MTVEDSPKTGISPILERFIRGRINGTRRRENDMHEAPSTIGGHDT
jgi:hypothetical protein